MGAVVAYNPSYLRGYVFNAEMELTNILRVCNADKASEKLDSIFRQHTTVEILQRAYQDQVRPYEYLL